MRLLFNGESSGRIAVGSRPARAYGFVMDKVSLSRPAPFWLVLLAGCQSVSCDVRAPESEFAAARERMVRQQLTAPGRDITNARVLGVMGKVPRHEFVPTSLRGQAYEDHPLPIGFDQTISQPFIVAFMTEKLEPKPADKVLEIGTGSGYQAAVLAGLVSNVFTIEIVEPLARRAEADLKRLGYSNVKVRAGDGYKGWPEAAPFDAIIVTCAPERVPQPLVDQLKDGGRMIIPVGAFGDQQLYLLQKKGGRVEQRAVLPVRFVPMTGGSAKDL
jgi:protein-L-isoaspartate(D-aspartate) O-methyltransferase